MSVIEMITKNPKLPFLLCDIMNRQSSDFFSSLGLNGHSDQIAQKTREYVERLKYLSHIYTDDRSFSTIEFLQKYHVAVAVVFYIINHVTACRPEIQPLEVCFIMIDILNK